MSGIRAWFDGGELRIDAEPQRIFDFLISTYDAAMRSNAELIRVCDELRMYGIEVRKDFQPGIPMIMADPEQLRQVFLNLFTNAADAMPSGGTLTLRVRAGQNLLVEIVDTGTGIAAADLPRVMETFFTTKPSGKGTGLGLPICRRIVEAHGGKISIESEPGNGATVRIVLPVDREEGRNER